MIRNTVTNGVVIRRRWTQKTTYLVVVSAALTALAVLWGSYQLGLYHGDTTESDVYQQLDVLKQHLNETEEEKLELKFSVAKSERQLQIDRVAFEELAENLRVSNKKISELAKELVFYQSILSPQQGQAGIQIHQSKLIGPISKQSREYGFEVTLLQGLRHKKKLGGTLGLIIEGKHAETGASMTHNLGNRRYKFRYYQKLEGHFDLPGKLVPERLVVTARTEGKVGATIQKKYRWDDILSRL